MKKSVIVICLLWIGTFCANAQNVVSGKVTDREGNPIPGAKVVVAGGTESVLTELDGTFRIESQNPARKVQAFYSGMQPKTVKPTQSPMTIVMSKTNIWNRKPLKPTWLLSLQAGFPDTKSMQPSVGLMFGRFNKIGWYIKGLFWPIKSADLNADEYGFHWYDEGAELNRIDEEYWWTTGKSEKCYNSVTAGVIVGVWQALHAYAGVGYGWRNVNYEIAGGKYVQSNFSYSATVADIGLLIRLGRLSLNGGVQMAFADDIYCIGNVGVGVCF